MSYGTVYITTQGKTLAAKTLQSQTLTFSRFEVGSGIIEDGSAENIQKVTSLVNKVMEFEVTKISKNTDTQVTVNGLLNNTNIEEGFYLKELGLYAIDNETEEEILFAYVNYGDEAEYINTSDIEKKEIYYEVVIAVDNAENVEITVDDTEIYITEKEAEIMNTISTGTVTIASGTTITNGYEVTLPIKYEVGNNSLTLYLAGEKLIKATDDTDGHYTEVGNDDEESVTIAFYRTDDDGDWILTENVILEAVVKGVEQSEE